MSDRWLVIEVFLWCAASFLTCITSFLNVLIVAFSKGSISPKVKLKYILYASALTLWSGNVFIFSITDNYSVAYRATQWLHFGAIFIPIFLLDFVTSFFDIRTRLNRLEVLAGYMSSVFFAGIDLLAPRYFISDVVPKRNFSFFPEPGELYVWWMALFAYLVVSSHVKALSCYRRAVGEEKRRSGFLIFPSVIAYTGCVAYFLPVYNIFVFPYPWGSFGSVILSSVLLYGILKHQLLDIGIVLRKSLVYTLLISFFTGIYVISVTFLEKLFQQSFGYTSSYSVLTLIGIVILVEPMRIWIQSIVDHLFFKGSLEKLAEEKLHLETELERAERLKSVGVLAAGMAHEVKNPLSVINTFITYLPEKYDDPVFKEKLLRIVPREVSRIQELISDLLLFSKPSEPQKRGSYLAPLIRQIPDLPENDFLKSNVKVNLQGDDVQVKADPDQIKQAMLNIIMNAMDAMKPDGGKLNIQIDAKEGYVEIAVQDTGSGISEEAIKHIFDPFFTSKEHGTGLGLAITHTIIDKNGGKIHVQSPKREGTRFTILLPSPTTYSGK